MTMRIKLSRVLFLLLLPFAGLGAYVIWLGVRTVDKAPTFRWRYESDESLGTVPVWNAKGLPPLAAEDAVQKALDSLKRRDPAAAWELSSVMLMNRTDLDATRNWVYEVVFKSGETKKRKEILHVRLNGSVGVYERLDGGVECRSE